MKPLKERIKERSIAWKKEVSDERALESFLQELTKIIPLERIDYTPGYFCLYLTIESKDLEEVEERFIPQISELTEEGWSKQVYHTYVHYFLSFRLKNHTLVYLHINLLPSETCIIKKVPTGKMVSTTKTVTVEVPEYEYLVDCEEEGEGK